MTTNKWQQYFVKFTMFFFLIVSSIMLHEFIHFIHFSILGSQVDEVVLLGWRNLENDAAVGWVTASSSFSLNAELMELIAYGIQLVYLILGYFFFKKTIFKPQETFPKSMNF